MESGGERRAMENGVGTMRKRKFTPTEWVMCSTCSGFVGRKMPTPKPDDEVVEVVTEAGKMRALMKAVLLHGPLQEMEPAEATEEQWKVLQMRRRIMMETKKCPACSGPLLEACPAAVLTLQGGKERKKIATAMVGDARSEQKLKQSREEGTGSSSGLNGLKEKKKKVKSEDKEGSGSKRKKAKRSSEMEGSGSKEAKMEDSRLKPEEIENIIKSDHVDWKTKIEILRLLKKSFELLNEPPVKSQLKEEAKMEDSKSAVGNRKSKMVTYRLDKAAIDLVKNQPPPRPLIFDKDFVSPSMIDIAKAHGEVDCVFLEYLQCYYSIKGYAEIQLEVLDDEGDDQKFV